MLDGVIGVNRPGMSRRTALVAAATIAAAAGCSAPTSRTATPPPAPSADSPSTLSAASKAPLPAEIVNGPRDRPAVALTFHGQGDEQGAVRLLDALSAGGAHVTVLAVGTWLQQLPAIAKRILDGGHELGNHTQHHRDIAAMRAPDAYAEIEACAAQLERLTGSIGAWFRPSQTVHSTPTIEAQAARAGYPTCLSYDVDSLDHTDPGAAAIVRATLQHVQNGSIVSLHFGHPGTVAAMPAILDGLRSRGLRAVTVTELMR
jgi:peptidoglycan/xylan/chitin deacetylase (PgdA/CDA1 family)